MRSLCIGSSGFAIPVEFMGYLLTNVFCILKKQRGLLLTTFSSDFLITFTDTYLGD